MSHIVGHIMDHLILLDVSRADGWIGLWKEPEIGLYWESHRFQGHFQGGGPYSIIPLVHEDVIRLYGCEVPRKDDERVEIEGAIVEHQGEANYDQAASITQHLEAMHFLELGVQRESGTIRLYFDPVDGYCWEISLARGYVGDWGQPFTLTRILQAESEELYPDWKEHMMCIGRPESIVGATVDYYGMAVENKAAKIARHLLDLHLLDVDAERGDESRKLYYDPRRQQYWELVYLESGVLGEGPPSLIPVSRDDIEGLYGVMPLSKSDKIQMRAMPVPEGEFYDSVSEGLESKDQIVRIVSHLADKHFIKTGTELRGKALYRDPVDDSYFEIYSDDPVKVVSRGPKSVVTESIVGGGPLTLVQVSYTEIVESYGSAPLADIGN
ncbi:MAG: hypothetical protein ABFD54_12130 [Armatimonadota bacterium]